MQYGYSESFKNFIDADLNNIINQLKNFVPDAGDAQIQAWRDSILLLQANLQTLGKQHPESLSEAFVILEYRIPLESRQVDALLLVRGSVVVIEYKGRAGISQADIDQASAYGRDLQAYHRDCASLSVFCFLVPTLYSGQTYLASKTCIVGPNNLTNELAKCIDRSRPVPNPEQFLAVESYQPLPSLIKAARELFNSNSLPRIHRAAMATEPTLKACSEIIHQTAMRKRRALILICGVPGAGKTLVGLQLAHAKSLDDLTVAHNNNEKPVSPAVFLSGNGPLVEVLQHELRSAGGDGKAFVRSVHDYVKTYTHQAEAIPPHHILIYDEAQRAFDAKQVEEKQKNLPQTFVGLSEPELFIRFAERVPEWCVVVGLVGTGQEIHIGEEAGLGQWQKAIDKSNEQNTWDIYLPEAPHVQSAFNSNQKTVPVQGLELKQTIRFHMATYLNQFVEQVLEGNSEAAQSLSDKLEEQGYALRLTHDLALAKEYLADRYSGNKEARYGLLASSRDKDLKGFGIPNDYNNQNKIGAGGYAHWYSSPAGTEGSCTTLFTLITEFGAQGLELDACLLAWGTDLIRISDEWSNRYASKYKESHRVRDSKTLRINAYRVLLTRGRDGCVIFIPPIPNKMRETYRYLRSCGFKELSDVI